MCTTDSILEHIRDTNLVEFLCKWNLQLLNYSLAVIDGINPQFLVHKTKIGANDIRTFSSLRRIATLKYVQSKINSFQSLSNWKSLHKFYSNILLLQKSSKFLSH
jgi:hypothetical protein